MLHACPPGRPQATLARDDLELAVPQRPHRNGLDDADLLDGGRQLVEGPLLELLARLVGVGPDALHRHLRNAPQQAGPVFELVQLTLLLRRLVG